MTLTITMRQTIDTPATQTIFTEAEHLLNQTEYQKALSEIGKRKNMNKYNSMMDFLFCETFTEFRWDCFRFYNNNGPPFRDMMTKAEIKHFDRALVVALEFAYTIFSNKRAATWKQFRDEFLTIFEIACA